MNFQRPHLNCELQNKSRRSNTFNGSQGMWDWQSFVKTFNASLCNYDLLNEHNFSLIHLAGQYLSYVAEEMEIHP